MEYSRYADIKRLNFITAELQKQLQNDAEILDVGCGNGIIARALGKNGFNVYGIDVSEKAIEKARELNECKNVHFDSINAEELVAEKKQYHAVICSEVLEHLHEPSRLLGVINEILYDDGILIVTVPNGKGPRELFVTRPLIKMEKKNNWLWKSVKKVKGVFGYKGTTIQSDADSLTHLQFFTKSSHGKLAESSGFSIKKFGKTNFVEDVFPFSLLTKHFVGLQKLDCKIAELLPYSLTGGFVSVWEKNSLRKPN